MFWKLSKDQLYIICHFKSRFVEDKKSNLLHLSYNSLLNDEKTLLVNTREVPYQGLLHLS